MKTSLDSLPAEVLDQIGQLLPRKCLSSFSQVSRRIHAATAYALFDTITFDLRQSNTASRPLEVLRPATWKYFRSLAISYTLMQHEDPQCMGYAPIASETATEIWLRAVSKLTSLCKVSIYLQLECMFDESDAYPSPWPSFKNVAEISCLPATRNSTGPEPALELEIWAVTISPASSLWKIILPPFSLYDHISVEVERWREVNSVPQDPFHFISIFQGAHFPSISLYTYSPYDLQVATAVRSVTTLKMVLDSQEDYCMLGECLDSISKTLETLVLRSTRVEHFNLRRCSITFPQLKVLKLEGQAFHIFGDVAEQIVALPALQSIRISGLLDDPPIHANANSVTARARYFQAIAAIVALDEALPAACCDRRYCVTVSAAPEGASTVHEALESLASKGNLVLDVHVELGDGDRCEDRHISVVTGLRTHSGLSLSGCRAAVTSLALTIESYIPENHDLSEKLELNSLKCWSITTWYTAQDPEDTERILSHLSAPQLVHINMTTEQEGFESDCRAITNHLSDWPVLRSIEYNVGGLQSQVSASPEIRALQEACQQRMVNLVINA